MTSPEWVASDAMGRLPMAGSCAWVFAGGDFSVEHVPFEEVSDRDQFICVDRGVEYCLAAGFKPSLLVGDFDSADAALLNQAALVGIPRYTYPSDKAAGDLELALQIVAENPPERVVILGVTGGRTDHMLFNWMLPVLRSWPFRLSLIDGTTYCHVLQGEALCRLNAVPGQTLSLLAQSRCLGVDTAGLHYTLAGATLERGSTLGLSNVVTREEVSVSMKSGTLLVLLNRVA